LKQGLMILALVLCAGTLSANTAWGHQVFMQHAFVLGVWVSLTLLVETIALAMARPVRAIRRGDVHELQRAGWNYLLLVVLLMNVVSGALGTLASYLVAVTFGSDDYIDTSIALVVLTHFTATLVIEVLVVSRMLVLTGWVFTAVFVGNLISYSMPIAFMLYIAGPW
jgi:hypothetical protein